MIEYMDKEKIQPTEVESKLAVANQNYDEVRKIFAEMYLHFERSNFDTLLLYDIRNIIVQNEHMKKIGEAYYSWRMFLEYALLHVPEDKTMVREFLLVRINNTWIMARTIQWREFINNKMKDFQGIMNGSIREVFSQLVSHNVIAEINTYEDGSLINDDIEGSYEFGNVGNGVLVWRKDANELANAIYQLWLSSSREGQRAYDIILKIASSGKIKLQYCKWQSVQDILGDLISQRIKGQKNSISPALISILTSILQDILPVQKV